MPCHIEDWWQSYHSMAFINCKQKSARDSSNQPETHGPRSFSVAAPTLWNSVPQSIRSIMTIETFKSQLKTYLFEKDFGQN